MWLDHFPLWMVLAATLSFVLLSLEVGVILGRRRARRGAPKLKALGTMLGATMALVAFMLAFAFDAASVRHDARKALVIKEANAIETTWLRAGVLPEPYRGDVRVLLRDYVDVRVQSANRELDVKEAVRRAESLHEELWSAAMEVVEKSGSSETLALFIRSLNEVIDLHLERLTLAIRNRVPSMVWLTLYVLLMGGMVMMGTHVAQSGSRHFVVELAVSVAFSSVLFLIADLDRPQEGLMNVGQEAMSDLQAKLHDR